ncbi:hypothetical protein [Bordetella genomosp. 4]|uniref:Glycine zipper family protein n=1 Tax=Bordetella genomosp. 4 TaxID=463044 RepID=A0A261U1Y1_9BORD|nr:hypothetical protein [Bordetella genomosp. 4]OZI49533.1 hypothetical protein CAL21_08145 [Bordetella genomosp. 4]OZI55974.1 hypothetical protein CAL20_10980 [Bordetella genomosp. 4]
MSLIVAARYQTFDQAGVAAEHLQRHGYAGDQVHTFYVNTAGSHDRFPVGGDRREDPDATGGVIGVLLGASILGVLGAALTMLAVRNFEYSSLIVIAAGGVGAYVGALIGAMVAVGRVRRRRIRPNGGVSVVEEHPPVRAAGVLLAVTVSSDKETEVARLLRESGGQDVERANGRWENGKWQDFDPLVPPEPEPAAR